MFPDIVGGVVRGSFVAVCLGITTGVGGESLLGVPPRQQRECTLECAGDRKYGALGGG